MAETIRWYDEQAPGLGGRFLEALDATLERIVEHPQLYREVLPTVRRALFPRPFPYMVLFTLAREYISVYAVIHQARRPERWAPR